MTEQTPDHEPSSNAEAQRVFDDYVTQLRDEAERKLRTLCAEQPDLRDDLEQLHEGWCERAGWRTSPSVAERLAAMTDADLSATTPLDSADARADTPTVVRPRVTGPRSLLHRLHRRGPTSARYRVDHVVGRGGMGVVLRVWDEDLRRPMAMKVIRSEDRGPRGPSSMRITRFLEEAQITGQLEHPGIVPVHELGADDDGAAYFTMRLVKGSTLNVIFDRVRSDDDEWTLPRALGVLLRVCEAMAYAHSRDVIHRDLKPANIMVGSFGETYVMDWGLARILDHPIGDATAIDDESVDGSVSSDRHDRTPMMTMAGDVLGTPAYMPPEQARGEIDRMGPRSDVYSVGAILYQLLAGHRPYHGVSGNREILQRVVNGPPASLDDVRPAVPGELVAICQTAMARAPEDRFEDMKAMADELRAFLENRVVHSYETGPWAELKKWVRRNRGVAAALLGLIVVLVSAGFGLSAQERRRTAEAVRNFEERAAAAYIAEADDLGPIHPDSLPRMERWLAGAESLLPILPRYEEELRALRGQAASQRELPPPEEIVTELRFTTWLIDQYKAICVDARNALATGRNDTEWTTFDTDILEIEIPRLEARMKTLEEQAIPRIEWSFDDPARADRHDRLGTMTARLRALAELVPEVRHACEQAGTIRARSIEDVRSRWRAAIESIGDVDESPAYGGLVLEPQIGLVPLGRNAQSGLWEFWHILSGAEPTWSPAGVEMGPDTGLVFVLIPPGRLLMGAEAEPHDPRDDTHPTDPAEWRHDPHAKGAESPVHRVALAPFFMSKFEMTQGQWLAATGDLPSETVAGMDSMRSPRISRMHPVEQISWLEADHVLTRWGLVLPTEAQWEWAARGAAEALYVFGDELDELEGHVNSLDAAAEGLTTTERTGGGASNIDDGYSNSAPVDSFTPNGYALHHVLGNVWEWTRDWYDRYRPDEIDPLDGEHDARFSNAITCRGGGFESPLVELRPTHRWKRPKNARDEVIGVRPSRAVDP